MCNIVTGSQMNKLYEIREKITIGSCKILYVGFFLQRNWGRIGVRSCIVQCLQDTRPDPSGSAAEMSLPAIGYRWITSFFYYGGN
jgi:hypothetical protein